GVYVVIVVSDLLQRRHHQERTQTEAVPGTKSGTRPEPGTSSMSVAQVAHRLGYVDESNPTTSRETARPVDLPTLPSNGMATSNLLRVQDDDDDDSYTPTGSGPLPKRQKLLFLWEYLTLRGFFRLLGRQVGTQPLAFIAVACLLSLNSLGMYKMVLKDRIRDGYTPINAPSRYETDVIRQFWNSSGDPMMTLMIMVAKDGRSMHRKAHIDEAASVIRFFNSNFSVDFEGEKLVFNKMCEPYCGMTTAFDLFKTEYDNVYAKAIKGENVSSMAKLHYPVANLNGFEVHLERSMFGVRTRPAGTPFSHSDGIEQRITNMEHVEVIMMIFRGDKGTERLERQMATWELAAYDYAQDVYDSNLLDIMLVGTDVLDREMIRDGSRMMPFFAAGFGIMISFVSICVLATALFYDEMDPGKLLIACVATLCPILAITSSYGIVSLLGCRINSFMLVMPFLIMGIGVDDAFLMTHSWQRMSRQGYGVPERLGMVYEEVGPSITITSLTNFLSFGIGAFTPTPEIRLFCLVTAIAMAVVFVLQLVLFGPILAIACRFEKRKDEHEWEHRAGWRKRVEEWFENILTLYCKLIGHKMFTIAIVTATCVYWYFGIIGLMSIKTRLDAVKILPKDSPIQKPNHILTNIVWAEYHPVTILVNAPFDVSNPYQVARFFQMVNDFESLHHAKDKASSLIWLRDYADYSTRGEPIVDLFSMMLGEMRMTNTEKVDPLATNMTLDKLDKFLASPFYKHWSSFLRQGVNEHGERVIDQFWINVAYQNTSSWEVRIDLMEEWREIAARYKDLNASVWEPNGMFVDQMLSLKGVAVQTGILTLVCMAVVCAIFIPNPCSVITASIAIASISLGVMGFLSWWGFDLDPVVMAAVLMSIGMSVDFTAHVSYHYQLTNRKEIRSGKVVKIPVNGQHHKLRHTLHAVGWPMLQAGVSTIFCILPLLFLNSYSTSVFVCTIFLVVSWGLLHGLIVLPSFLSCLPEFLTNANCYRTFLSTSSEKSCRYAGAPRDEVLPMQDKITLDA
ncbi:ptr-5, partial [Pristionchus pacificus]|uniref:Ptr-5 n=1 Tax=Pristionchus pacificus TaxID=54126 RepID=A0A2A6BFZ5_PRIPA